MTTTAARPPAPIRVHARTGTIERGDIARAIDAEWRARFAAATAIDTDTPALVTIPNVELLEVGENWETSTGTFTWSVSDLQSAVAAQADPSIRTPVIKLGHVDARFDGQPSIGRIENLRLTNNDQTLVGDLVGVPYWLAECMASAFPRRSIEGFFDFTTRTGNTWAFALTGVALLGDAYPAIDTLEDVKALFGKEPPVMVPVDQNEHILASEHGELRVAVPVDASRGSGRANAADVGNTTKCTRSGCGHPGSMHNDTADGDNTGACNATGCDCSGMMTSAAASADNPPEPRRVAADVSVNDLVNAFYEDGPGGAPGNYWWWIREVRVDPAEVIVDDDEGHLYRVPYTIGSGDGQGAVDFGEPQEVRIQYVNVAAAGQTIRDRFANPVAAGRPRRRTNASDTEGGHEVKLTEAQLKALGLEPDATDEAIAAALDAKLVAPAPDGGGSTAPDAAGSGETTAAGDAGANTTPPAADANTGGTGGTTTPEIPEGMVLVDASLLDGLKAGASLAVKHEEDRVAAERARVVDDAIRSGKIAASRKDHWIDRMKVDPEGTVAWLAAAEAVVPVQERGYAGEPGADGGTPAEAETAYPESWKALATAARKTSASRIKVGRD